MLQLCVMEETTTPPAPRQPRRKAVLAGIIGVVIVCVLGAFYLASRQPVRIPGEATEGVTFPIYIPQKLPDGYKLDEKSFKYVPSEGVFVFQATNKAGDNLVFSEQGKPTSLNLDDFTGRQLIDARKLPNLPFSATTGKTLDKKNTLLSVVTDTTWLIMTTTSEVDNQELHDVAAGLVRY